MASVNYTVCAGLCIVNLVLAVFGMKEVIDNKSLDRPKIIERLKITMKQTWS